VPPWEKDEHQHMKSCGYCRGHVDAGSELLTKVHKQGYESLNWELDYDHHKHHKESRTFDLKYVRLIISNQVTLSNLVYHQLVQIFVRC
jgi:hypothetical protein